MAGCCERGEEISGSESGSTKCGKLLDCLRKFYLLKKVMVPFGDISYLRGPTA